MDNIMRTNRIDTVSHKRCNDKNIYFLINRATNKKMKKLLLVIHTLIPIFVGALIYYFSSSEVIFVKQIDKCLGISFHPSVLCKENVIFQFIRNHFLDMLWGYALVFALFFVLGNNAAVIGKTFLIAFSFSAIMEFLQITPRIHGTFDVWDVVVLFLAEIIAVFIIKFYFRGGTINEKEN